MKPARLIFFPAVLCICFVISIVTRAQEASDSTAAYFPAKGEWQRRKPSEVGMNDAKIAEAVAWAATQETDWPADFSRQEEIFGRPLGPVPNSRAGVNGVIVRKGYIIAEFGRPGELEAPDPSYSVAKSYLSTILSLTIDRGMIKSIDDPVSRSVSDGGYDSEHNAKITWRHHATQTSEWQGELFGKHSTFLGRLEFGGGEMKPREIREPGTHYEYNDVRVNRFSLSLLRVWKQPLPEILKREIMDPIGASDTWTWHAYDNSTVDVDGTPMKSVSGGTRWGGGLWMSTLDHARFGLLVLRHGEWNGKRIISSQWLREATMQQGVSRGYGYMWWLNTESRWKGAPRESFSAQGAGSNTIWIDPVNDLVVVWRWHRGGDAQGEYYRKILSSLPEP